MFDTQIYLTDQLKQDNKLQKNLLKTIQFRNKVMGVNETQEEALQEWQTITQNPLIACCIAVYEQEDFVGFLTLKYLGSRWWTHKNNNTVSTANLSYSIGTVNFPNYQTTLNWENPHPWKAALDTMAQFAIGNQVYSIYSEQPDRPAIRRAWKSGKDAMRYCSEWYDEEKQTYKWHRNIHAIVEPNSRVKDDDLFHITSIKKKDFPTVIREFSLKNEYRPDWDKVKHWWPED